MILDYVKGFLTLFLLIKVLVHFIPKNGFEKYIAFFSGAILVIGLLYPLLQLAGQETSILEKLEYEQWESGLLEVSQEAEILEETGRAYVQERYGKVSETEQELIEIEAVKIGVDIQMGDMDE